MTINEIIQIATNELGTFENPPNSNNVKYNTWFYGQPVSGSKYPWCAAFISWIFKGTNLCKKTASCVNMLEWFEKNNQAVKKPRMGDIVFFKYPTNNRRTNHVGLVIKVQGTRITTIEGNTSKTSADNGGKVMIREHINDPIVAYGRPKYNSDPKVIAKEVIAGKWSKGEERKKLLTEAGYDVQAIQLEVNKILMPEKYGDS